MAMATLSLSPSSFGTRRPVFCCSSSSVPSADVSKTVPKGWKSFCKNVSGEWSGSGVDFDRAGKSLALPSVVVPQEYDEWGVKLHDWETYCATLASDRTLTFYNKTLRLYPTVGCGATSVTIYKTEEQSINPEADQEALLAFHSNGSYIAVWGEQKVVEHCLVNENNQDGPRVRILHLLKDFEQPSVEVITVYKEQWEDDFQSGKTVESCLTRPAGISIGRRLHPGDLRGNWETLTFSFSCHDSNETLDSINKLVAKKTTTDALKRQYLDSHVLLTEGLWSNVKNVGSGDLEVEGGWLINSGLALVSKCTFSSGKVQKFDLEVQYRVDKIKKTYRTFRLDDSQDPRYS